MVSASSKFVPAGTKIRVVEPGAVPGYSKWDDDKQRTSTAVKRRLQQLFFKGDRRVQAEVVYISSESERDRLRQKGQIKVQLRDPAGSCIVITAESAAVRAS